MRILLFNPNRSLHITERMAASARAELRAPHQLLAITGSAGPQVVHDAATLQQAFAPDADPAALLPVLLAACQRLRQQGADSIVLAGAVLCGYDKALQAALGLPVLDGVRCAVRQLQDEGTP